MPQSFREYLDAALHATNQDLNVTIFFSYIAITFILIIFIHKLGDRTLINWALTALVLLLALNAIPFAISGFKLLSADFSHPEIVIERKFMKTMTGVPMLTQIYLFLMLRKKRSSR